MARSFQLELRLTESKIEEKMLVDLVGRASARNLKKAGAFIMTGARSSIKRPKKKDRYASSAPGNPPFQRMAGKNTGIRAIYFDYDKRRHSVIVGPIKLPAKSRGTPVRLEIGGVGTYLDFLNEDTTRRTVPKTTNYRARPFMLPAFRRELQNEKFMAIWRDSVRR